MSICETVKTQKQYYILNIRYAYFSINRRLHRERESKRERESMSIIATVKTQKLYYLSNMRYAYFPINGRLHRNRERGYVHL